jgi:hypothetical protein
MTKISKIFFMFIISVVNDCQKEIGGNTMAIKNITQI